MPKIIQTFKPKFDVSACLREIKECLTKGWTGIGWKTVEFEKKWCEYTELPCAHFVNSGTAALHLAVSVLKARYSWKDGDEIITTPLTFVATNHAILYEHLTPIFADVDEHLCLDPKSVYAHITPRTRAVMFVGLGGQTGRLNDITVLCKGRGLKLILDAAHMAGTTFYNRHVGHESDVSSFSFHAIKPVPTADAGMVCFKEPELDAEARKRSWLGISKDIFTRMKTKGVERWRQPVESVGWKYNGNSIMAALALVGLKDLDMGNEQRRNIAHWYDLHLGDKCSWVERIPIGECCVPSRHLYQILVDDRDALIDHLEEQGIMAGVHYEVNTNYPMYAWAAGTCPNAERIWKRLISLPMHLHLKHSDVKRICEAIAGFRHG